MDRQGYKVETNDKKGEVYAWIDGEIAVAWRGNSLILHTRKFRSADDARLFHYVMGLVIQCVSER